MPQMAPRGFVLNQNFPNPFNPETTFRYRLAERTHTKLVIYNTLGQQVRVLTDGNEECGEHSLQWDGRDDAGRALASGVYFYRLTTGDASQIGKAILLR